MKKQESRILIVDDDTGTRGLLRATLVGEDCEVIEASGGAEAIHVLEAEPLDLGILDIMMPQPDGFEVLRQLRQRSHVPVIMLSARSEMADKMQCFDLGADDYVTKPFAPEELLARARVSLRRVRTENPQASPVFDDGYLRMDLEERVITILGEEVPLTRLECSLLRELVAASGKVVEYDALVEAVWGEGCRDDRDSLHHRVNGLRGKIEPDPHNPRYILNIPGIGYRFKPDGNS